MSQQDWTISQMQLKKKKIPYCNVCTLFFFLLDSHKFLGVAYSLADSIKVAIEEAE